MRQVYCVHVITVLSCYYRIGDTPLHYAGNGEVASILLSNGADPNKRNDVSIINNEMYILIVYYMYCAMYT